MHFSHLSKTLGVIAFFTVMTIGTAFGSPLQALAAPLRIYAAGESIERRNCMSEAPFTSTGALNNPGNNDTEQYGWMIPFAEKLKLRRPGLAIEFVGASPWLVGDDYPYDGQGACRFYPTPGRSSALSGSDNYSWMNEHGGELSRKQFCYDVAFVSRGGNDKQTDDASYKQTLKQIIDLAVHGSSCNRNPLVYVTGHMPDSEVNATTGDAMFVARVQSAVNEYQSVNAAAKVRFVDQFTPFKNNTPTTAFPSPNWRSGAGFQMNVIGREGDGMHPKRFASIYAGEAAANAVNLDELTAVMGGSTGSSTPEPAAPTTPTPSPRPEPAPVAPRPEVSPVAPNPRPRVASADLGIALFATPSSAIAEQQTIAVRVPIQNRGPATAERVIVEISTPANTDILSISRTSQGSCSKNAASVRCDLHDLASGRSIVFTITYRPRTVGVFAPRGVVRSNTADLNTSNNESGVRVTVTAIPRSNLVGRWLSANQTCRLVRGVERCSMRGRFEVRNVGTKMAGAHRLGITLSSNATLETRDVLLRTYAIGAIAAGRSRIVVVSIPMLPVAVHPAYFIGMIDSTRVVAELVEGDNTAPIQVR